MITISKTIEIDAAHRVPDHGSKCRNLHGHRYKIEALVSGELASTGAQTGMVTDFSFLKELMVQTIDLGCDHGTILSWGDPLLPHFVPDYEHRIALGREMDEKGYVGVPYPSQRSLVGKLYILRPVPTAENLAQHWFLRMESQVEGMTDGRGWLTAVRVWETPTSWATHISNRARVVREEQLRLHPEPEVKS